MSHGRIELLNRQSAYDCMIADISIGGARVIIENAPMLPDEFLLEVPSKGLRKRTTVRWREVSELGVSFLETDEHVLAVRLLALEEEVRALKEKLEALTK